MHRSRRACTSWVLMLRKRSAIDIKSRIGPGAGPFRFARPFLSELARPLSLVLLCLGLCMPGAAAAFSAYRDEPQGAADGCLMAGSMRRIEEHNLDKTTSIFTSLTPSLAAARPPSPPLPGAEREASIAGGRLTA